MSEHIQTPSDAGHDSTLTNQIRTTSPIEHNIEASEGWRDEERAVCPSSSASTTSSFLLAATIPPRLRREETTPGAVCVPGLARAIDHDQYDNLLDMENDYDKENTNSDIGIDSNNSINSLSRLPYSTSMTFYNQNFPNPIPIVAELAPSHLYSEQEVEERIAGRLEAQMEVQIIERLQQEVDRLFAQGDRPHVIADVVGAEDIRTCSGIDYINSKTEEVEGDNFKICGIRRICWGTILCVIMLLAIVGGGGTFLWFSRAREKENDNIQESGGAGDDTQLPQSTPTPTSTIISDNSIDNTTSTNSTKTPVTTPTPTPLKSNEPSATPSIPFSIERRREYLITSITPHVLPDNFTDLPKAYFVNDTYSTQFAALNWMAATDIETDIFGMNTQLLVERYVLAILYFSTGGAQTWTESLSFLSSGTVCDWNNDQSIQKVIISDGARDNGTEKIAEYTPLTKGVFCKNGSFFVTSIQLPDNSLVGLIPWELSLLKNLNEMNFDSNLFYGSIPIELGRLSRLKTLWFKSNNLSGSLPMELSNATKLASIDLEDNILTSILPPEWGSLSNLFYVSLRLNSITGYLPSEWRILNRLKTLDLEGNQLKGTLPKEYGELTELETLYYESNRIEGLLPSSFGSLTKLVNLYVHDNRFLGAMPREYSALTSLRNFWFHRNLLTGSVDEIFCDSYPSFKNTNLTSNCLGNGILGFSPQIQCSCCTTCCDNNGTKCVKNLSQ